MGLKDIIEHGPGWLTIVWAILSAIGGYLLREYTRTRDHENRIKAIEDKLDGIAEREAKEEDRKAIVKMVVSELGRFTEAVERRSQ